MLQRRRPLARRRSAARADAKPRTRSPRRYERTLRLMLERQQCGTAAIRNAVRRATLIRDDAIEMHREADEVLATARRGVAAATLRRDEFRARDRIRRKECEMLLDGRLADKEDIEEAIAMEESTRQRQGEPGRPLGEN